MIGYTFVGANDLDASLAFYDALAEVLGGKRLFQVPNDRGWFYGNKSGAMLAVASPYDEGSATSGNGTMVALSCPDTDTVQKAFDAALNAGGTPEGEPGWRVPDVFFGGYVRDPSGNKVCMYKMNSA